MNVRDFRLLVYFTEIVKAGSIRGAARKLRLSPAVVSAALFDLEEITGVTLINRTTRRMLLTPDGDNFLEKAMNTIDAFEETFEDIGNEQSLINGTVSLTMPTELASSWMPTIVSGFQAKFPEVKTFINADDAWIDLRTSEHDMAIRTEFSPTEKSGKNIIAAYPLELVCAPKYAEMLSGNLKRDLNKIPFIASDHQLKSGTLFYQSKQSNRESSLTIEPEFLINNRQVSLELARKGLGSALLISLSVEADLDAGTLIRVNEGSGFGYVIAKIAMRDRRPSRPAKALRDFLMSS